MISNLSCECFVQKRSIHSLIRSVADFTCKIPKRITSKHDQKPLGSYPVPPEHEMFWKNRRRAPGGYFHQAISPFQLKFCYPILHQAPARLWTRFSQGFWMFIYPCLITYAIIKIYDHQSSKCKKILIYD